MDSDKKRRVLRKMRKRERKTRAVPVRENVTVTAGIAAASGATGPEQEKKD